MKRLQNTVIAPVEYESPRRNGRNLELSGQVEKILRRLRMSVVFGGNKAVEGAVIHQSNNSRSWKSYETVAGDIAAAMGRLGCRDVVLVPDDMRLGEHLKSHQSHIAWLNSGGV
jgi:D-alanine-D-alanine ligase